MKRIILYIQKTWLFILIILLGFGLKFYKINSQYFWYDEVCTIRQTSGLSWEEFYELFPTNEIRNIQDFKDLLDLNKQDLTVVSQLRGISQQINLTPLHYALLVFWHRMVGSQDVHFRFFNIFLLVLTLPFLFLLCKKLFHSETAAWIAICLVVVSPFIHFYTQEARYIILCILLIIVCQYLFLEAIEKNRTGWWIGYALAGVFSMYASVLLGLIFLGHLIFMLIYERKHLVPFLIAGSVIFLVYLPWLITLIVHREEIATALEWQKGYGANQNFITLLISQVYFMAFSFVTFTDFYMQVMMFRTSQFQGNYMQFIVCILVMTLIVYAIVYSFRKDNRKTAVFLSLLLFPQFLLFYISDILLNSGVSLIWRYNYISYTGTVLFLVFLIQDKISKESTIFYGVFFGLVILGFLSIFLEGKDINDKMLSKDVNTAAYLSRQKKILLITDFDKDMYNFGSIGVLAAINACENENMDILKVWPDVKNLQDIIPGNTYNKIVVGYCREPLLQNLKQQFGEKLDSLHVPGIQPLWLVQLDN